jgi:hypothetical protein
MLLAATEKFEDIVSKKRENVGWVKVKTAAGREAHHDRWRVVRGPRIKPAAYRRIGFGRRQR